MKFIALLILLAGVVLGYFLAALASGVSVSHVDFTNEAANTTFGVTWLATILVSVAVAAGVWLWDRRR